MKKHFLLFSLFLFTALFALAQGETFYVFAPSGLKLRQSPSTKGKVLTTLEYGSPLQLLKGEKAGGRLSIEGIDGHWVKVKAGQNTGYLFDGFISSLQAPVLHKTWTELVDYLNEKYPGPSQSPEPVSMPHPYEEGKTIEVQAQKYSDRLMLLDISEECDPDQRLQMTGLSMKDAYLLALTFNSNFRKMKLKEDLAVVTIFSKGPANQEKQLSVNYIEDLLQYDRYLRVKYDSEGKADEIWLAFDSDAGSGTIEITQLENNQIQLHFSYSCH